MVKYIRTYKRCGNEFKTTHKDYYLCIDCGHIIEHGGI